jgi:hypothetical protein
MVFKRRKNVPFKYARFGSSEHKSKRSPFLNPNATIKHLMDINKLNINLKCKLCKSNQKIDILDLFIELDGKTKIAEGIKIMNIICNNCKGNYFSIS